MQRNTQWCVKRTLCACYTLPNTCTFAWRQSISQRRKLRRVRRTAIHTPVRWLHTNTNAAFVISTIYFNQSFSTQNTLPISIKILCVLCAPLRPVCGIGTRTIKTYTYSARCTPCTVYPSILRIINNKPKSKRLRGQTETNDGIEQRAHTRRVMQTRTIYQ